eukprot:s1060_g18.t1
MTDLSGVSTCDVMDEEKSRPRWETSLSITLGTAGMQGPRPAPPERPHKKLLRRIDLALRGLDFQALGYLDQWGYLHLY